MLPTDDPQRVHLAHLPDFVTEMRGYIADLHRQTSEMASPTRSGESAAQAVRLLRRLGHTITSLAQTLQIADIEQLGAALDEVMIARATAGPPTGAIVAPLTRLAVYLELRVNGIERQGRFIPPTQEEEAEMRRVCAALRTYLPPPETHAPTSAFHLLDDVADWEPAGVEFQELTDLPPESQAIVATFLRAGLSPDASASPVANDHRSPAVMETFIDELTESIEQMRVAIVRIQSPQDRRVGLQTLLELAHRLKGAAFTLMYVDVSTVTNLQESLLKPLRLGRLPLSNAVLQWLIASINALDHFLANIRVARESHDDQGSAQLMADLHEQYVDILASISTTRLSPESDETAPTPVATSQPLDVPTIRVGARQVDQLLASIGGQQLNRVAMERLRAQVVTSEEDFTRVIARLHVLEERLRAERYHRLTQIEGETRRLAGDLPLGGPRDPREVEFEQWMAMVDEVIADLRSVDLDMRLALNQLGRQGEYHDYLTEQTQRDVLALRQVPFSEMIPRLQLVLRATAIAEQKEVSLAITGEPIEIDRDIQSILLDPLAQLVRNAIVHGIESATERSRAGKPSMAYVTLRTEHAGDMVRITIADDGRGIDPQHIVQAALQTYGPDGYPLLDPERAAQLSRAEIFDLLFIPDLTTAPSVSATAGRGMGLAAVKRAIASIRGEVTVASDLGSGTSFTLSLPISLGMLRGYAMRAGPYPYVAIADEVVALHPMHRAQVYEARGKHWIRLDDAEGTPSSAEPDVLHRSKQRELPIIALSALIDQPMLAVEGEYLLLVRVDTHDYGIIADLFPVDQIVPEHPIVTSSDAGSAGAVPQATTMITRQVPNYLKRRGIRYASVTARGELMAVLDLPMLVRRAIASGQIARPIFTNHVLDTPPQGEHILVVDDSPSIQRGMLQILTAAGYTVEGARDGYDAWAQMRRSIPRLVLLDVEMPTIGTKHATGVPPSAERNFDGFAVLRLMRQHAIYQDVPVVMLTSRAASLYRDQAIALGAFEYLTKPCPTEYLLGVVSKALAGRATEVSVREAL